MKNTLAKFLQFEIKDDPLVGGGIEPVLDYPSCSGDFCCRMYYDSCNDEYFYDCWNINDC